ncbi:MAG: CHASE domain-containing protein [Phycisphaerales bacterium]|nr:CHASE domain-containing protein [Phycisphaerales bacterium]
MSPHQNAIRLLIDVLLSIVLTEVLVMWLLPMIAPSADGWRAAVLDGCLLGVIAGPLVLWRCRAAMMRCRMSHASKKPRSTERVRASLAAGVTLAIGISASIGIALATNKAITRAAEERFVLDTRENAAAPVSHMKQPLLVLEGVRALFAASKSVERHEFRQYVQSRNLHQQYPGLQAIGVIERVAEGSIASFVETQQADGAPTYTVYPSSAASEHWFVRFAESATSKDALLGLDFGRDPAILRLAHQAVSEDLALLTPLLNIASSDATPNQLLWLLPIYRNGAATSSADERWNALDGVAFAVISPEAIATSLATTLDHGASLDVYAGADAIKLMSIHHADRLHNDKRASTSRYHWMQRVEVGGQPWTIQVQSTPTFEATADHSMPALIAIGGSVLSMALAGVLWSMSTSRRRAIELAKEMTQQLRRLSMVAQNTTNAVLITDAHQRITWANKGFERLSEYTLKEVEGKHPDCILESEQTDSHTIARMREALRNGQGFRGEILNRSKRGREYWIEIDIQPVHDDDGRISSFIAVETDLSERKEVERALQEAKAAAEKAYEAKSRFLAAMSHEIRTPLNGIIGFADLLRCGADEGDEALRAEWMGIIHGSGEHLLALLNDVLDLAKLDADHVDIALAPCNPRKVISESALALQSRAVEKGISLHIEFDDAIPTAIRSDATRLRQILMNLVSNAVKFTEHGGVRVEVSATQDASVPRLRIAVRDTGIGMTPEQAQGLFQPFQQADKTIADRFGGTGLGLVISKRLAERLGGDITLSSEVGVGSVFTLEIAAPPLLPGESLPHALPTRHAWDNGAPGAARPLQGKHVLVADDVEANRKVCKALLERAGATVTTVNDGREAVATCQAQAFDLVLMDVQMPEMSGLDATRALRAAGYATPILALTAFSSGGDRDSCLSAGMNDFLSKPIESATLIHLSAHWAGQAFPSESDESPEAHPFEDDPALFAIARDWLTKLPAMLATARGALEQNDLEAVARIGHAIKGTGGSLGMPTFTEPAAALERAARIGDVQRAQLLLDQLERLHTDQVQDPRRAA